MTWCWHISCQHSADATRKFNFLVQQDMQQVQKKKRKSTIWWDYLSISWAQSNQKDQTRFFQHFCSSKIPCQELLRKKPGHSFYLPCLIPCKGLLYMNINPSHQNILRATLCAEGLTYLAKSRTCCCCFCLKFVRWRRYWRIPFCFAESMKNKLMNQHFHELSF